MAHTVVRWLVVLLHLKQEQPTHPTPSVYKNSLTKRKPCLHMLLRRPHLLPVRPAASLSAYSTLPSCRRLPGTKTTSCLSRRGLRRTSLRTIGWLRSTIFRHVHYAVVVAGMLCLAFLCVFRVRVHANESRRMAGEVMQCLIRHIPRRCGGRSQFLLRPRTRCEAGMEEVEEGGGGQ